MKQPARALIGYMPREEAVQLLSGSVQTAAAKGQEYESIWERHRKATQERADFKPLNPLVSAPPAVAQRLRAFKHRADVQAVMQTLDWDLGFADLTKSVLTYQRLILTRPSRKRLTTAESKDALSLIDVCLPPPHPDQFQGAFDPAQMTFTASSPNPNLRIGEFQVATVGGPDSSSQQILGFTLSFGSSFVQLVEYQGRWMVRDGYHRIYGLLEQGITQIPCVLVRAKTFQETGAERQGFFGHEILFGTKPPHITDFLVPELAANVEVPVTMKVVRIRAEEFVVPVSEPGELGG